VLPASFGVLGRVLPALFSLKALAAQPAVEPLFGDVWLPDLQVMAARSVPGSRDGLYFAAKGASLSCVGPTEAGATSCSGLC
jgi:hypothetical protein